MCEDDDNNNTLLWFVLAEMLSNICRYSALAIGSLIVCSTESFSTSSSYLPIATLGDENEEEDGEEDEFQEEGW